MALAVLPFHGDMSPRAVATDDAIVDQQQKTSDTLTGSPIKLERKAMIVNALHRSGDRGGTADQKGPAGGR